MLLGKQQVHSLADIVLDKLGSILPTYLKSNVLDKLLPIKKGVNIPGKSNYDGSISSEAGVKRCSFFLIFSFIDLK